MSEVLQRDQDNPWPYWLPYVSFMVIVAAAGLVPASLELWSLSLRVIVPLGFLLLFASLGRYPELRTSPGRGRHYAVDVLIGLAGAVIWMTPYVVFAGLSRPHEPRFDPDHFADSLSWLALALRFTGFGLVTPFMEELFLRSWLQRYADAFDRSTGFRDIPIGQYSLRSLLVVLLWFTLAHQSWEWPVAVPWLLMTQLWFYHRRRLLSLVIVHAATNAAIFITVMVFGDRFSLWYFL